jgi:hypothetical protein
MSPTVPNKRANAIAEKGEPGAVRNSPFATFPFGGNGNHERRRAVEQKLSDLAGKL